MAGGVHGGGGGMCGRGACMAEGGMHDRGGHAWQGGYMAGVHVCRWVHVWQGGMYGGGVHGRGGCAWQRGGMAGGVHGRGGHAWQRGACMAEGGMHGRGVHHMPPPHHKTLRDTVNDRAIRILLECILVLYSLVCKFSHRCIVYITSKTVKHAKCKIFYKQS